MCQVSLLSGKNKMGAYILFHRNLYSNYGIGIKQKFNKYVIQRVMSDMNYLDYKGEYEGQNDRARKGSDNFIHKLVMERPEESD